MSGIIGYDKLGAFTLGTSSPLALITDRTQKHVDRLAELSLLHYDSMTEEEKVEWNKNLKGAYNASDLNRVESAVEYLAELLRNLPAELKAYAESVDVAWDAFFDVPYDAENYNLVVKTDWTESDFPQPSSMERYLSNVVTLRNAIEYETDELPKNMRFLRWQSANAIEKALLDLYDAYIRLKAKTINHIELTAAEWLYSGDVYSGEV